jgi:hypothetical protein
VYNKGRAGKSARAEPVAGIDAIIHPELCFRRPIMRVKTALVTAILLGLAACRPADPGLVTQVLQPPTARPTATIRPAATRPAPTAAPTSEAPATGAPATATLEGLGGGGGSSVFLIDFSAKPTRVHRVDSFNGSEQSAFDAPGLTITTAFSASDQYLFYYDSSAKMVRRLDGAGSLIDLPFVNSGTGSFDVKFLPSPDGSRIAWGTSTLDPADANATKITLNVANADGSDLKTVLDTSLKNQSILPQPLQWSPDGGRFYFTSEPYGIGGYILFSGGPDLSAVDVASGQITPILKNKGCLCAMSVSPDGGTVAVVAGAGPLTLVLHDVASGGERSAPIDPGHLQAGDLLWAPDGHSLVYTMAVSNYDNPDLEKYTVVRVDAASLKQTTLIPDDVQLPFTALWPDSNMIWLGDKDAKVALLNPDTGAVNPLMIGRIIALGR